MFPKDVDLAQEAVSIWRAGVDAVLPARLVPRAVTIVGGHLRFEGRGPMRKFKLPLKGVRRICVVGAGKAGAGMAAALEETLGEEILETHGVHGLVCVPDDTLVALRAIELAGTRASHDNAATPEGIEAARRIKDVVSRLRKEDLLIVLLSGGGSSLLPSPVEGVTLEEKQRLVRRLQAAGADIREVNCVRKHLSELKGGGLVSATHAGLVVGLAISDVMGDSIDVIASGPTAPDPTTHSDALRILERHEILEGDPDLAPSVLQTFRDGAAGRAPETLKVLPDRAKNLVIGGIEDAVRTARRHAEVLGWRVLASTKPVGGDTRDLSFAVGAFVKGSTKDTAGESHRGVCLVSGGETTVRLGERPGLGGRNQELVLGVLEHVGLDGLRGACVLSAGTDGEDGPTDAAGAWVDESVAQRARELGLSPADHLKSHDSYRFFERTGSLLRTGFTGTNVMDLRVALVDVQARLRDAAGPAIAADPAVRDDVVTP